MNPTETLQNLDENFLFLLNLIKNHHQTFAGRPDKDILLQSWLHKLCIETDYVGIEQKRNRNVYLCKLLNCMQTRRLTGPFLQRPRQGKLKEWPLPMPVLEEPQWVRDLDAASKKATRIGGKDLKTYISTKRLDNNRGLCALLSVSVADERGEPGFKRIGTNKVWGDVEKEFLGIETEIAAEPMSPKKPPVEKIDVLEEKLQSLEANIPPEPLPLTQLVTPKPGKKTEAPKGVKSLADLKRNAQLKAKVYKPKLTKPTPPKRKQIDPASPTSPLSPDQVAFNAVEASIQRNVQFATTEGEKYYNELMHVQQKMDEMSKLYAQIRAERRMAKGLSPTYKSDAEEKMGELREERVRQLERQRRLEAELFAKTPSPQPVAKPVQVSPLSPDHVTFKVLEAAYTKSMKSPSPDMKVKLKRQEAARKVDELKEERQRQVDRQWQLQAELFAKTPSPGRPEEQHLSPTPPIVRELREKQQRRIVAQRRLRAKMNQQPPPAPPAKQTKTQQAPTTQPTPGKPERIPRQREVERPQQPQSSGIRPVSSTSGITKLKELQQLRAASQSKLAAHLEQQQQAQSFITPPKQQLGRAQAQTTPPTPENPKLIGRKEMEAEMRRQRRLEQNQMMKRDMEERAKMFEPQGKAKNLITPPKQQTRSPRATPPTPKKPDWIVKKYAGKAPVHIPSTEEVQAEQIRRALEIEQRQQAAQLRKQQLEQSLITPPKQQTRSPQTTPPTPQKPDWIVKKYAGKAPIHIPSSEEVHAEMLRQQAKPKTPPQWMQQARQMSNTTQSRTGLRPPSQPSGLRAPAAKASAYGLKPQTPSLTRQGSSTGLKTPSQLKFPKRG